MRDKKFRFVILLALICSLALAVVGSVMAANTVVTPLNPDGWAAANVRQDATVAITGNNPRSGNGSLEFNTNTITSGQDKADYEKLWMPDANRTLGNLTSIRYETYRASSSTVADNLTPVLRLYVADPALNGKYVLLIWERAYNGAGAVPTDVWETPDLTSGNFWMFMPSGVWSPSGVVQNYGLTLSDWADGSQKTGQAGDPVPPILTTNWLVVGVNVGVGSGWGNQFKGYVDNVVLEFGTNDVISANFELDPACSPFPVHNLDTGEKFCGIQEAIDDSDTLAGHTIQVAAGTFVEQVHDYKGVRLVGAGAGSSIIKAPASIPTAADPTSYVVRFTSGTSAEISGFTITGPGPSGCGSIRGGILVRDGTDVGIEDNTITAIRDNPFSGCQNGIAIEVGRVGTTGSATIRNNLIEDFQKNGINVSGTGSSAKIEDNTINGVGPTSIIAQNGIQFSEETTGSVINNTLTGFSYTPFTFVSTGMLLFGADVTIDGNTVSEGQVGIYQYGGTTTIKNNSVSSTATGTGSAGFWGMILYTGKSEITSNQITSSDGQGGTGLGIYDDASASTEALATKNIVSGWEYGVDVDGTNFTSVKINRNSITGNGDGLVNYDTFLVDGTCNWWGAADGPSGDAPGTGDTVSANVTFLPFLTTSNLDGACEPPVILAVDDNANAPWAAPVIIDVLANDSGSGLTIHSITPGAGNTVIDNGNGTVTFTRTGTPPNANQATNTTFTYTIKDVYGQTAMATVSVNVTRLNLTSDCPPGNMRATNPGTFAFTAYWRNQTTKSTPVAFTANPGATSFDVGVGSGQIEIGVLNANGQFVVHNGKQIRPNCVESVKKIDWNGFTPIPNQQFEICITNPNSSTQCKVVGNDQQLALNPGPAGVYTFFEKDPGADWDVQITGTPAEAGWTTNPDGSVSVNVLNGQYGVKYVATITNTYNPSFDLEIEKKVIEGDTEQVFQYTLSGKASDSFGLKDGQTRNLSLKAGTYELRETVPPGWIMTDIVCFEADSQTRIPINDDTDDFEYIRDGQGLAFGFSFSLGDGSREPAYCVFEQRAIPATLTIEKRVTSGDTSQVFTYNLSGDKTETFGLKHGESKVITDVGSGSFELREVVPVGWQMEDIVCNDTLGRRIPINDANDTFEYIRDNEGLAFGFSFKRGAGAINEPVYCIFEQKQIFVPPQTGKLTIQKNAEGGEDVNFPFTITGPEGFSEAPSLQGGGFASYPDITPGDYTITENVPDGWLLTGLLCNTVAIEPITNPITVTVEAGQEVLCTFTNSIKVVEPTTGKLTIQKNAEGGEDVTFPFTITGPEGFSEAPSLLGGGFASYPDITPGDYTITENVPDGWLLTGLLCNTVAIEPITNPITVTVEAGQEVLCTFTNSIKVVEPTTGKLTIQKNAEGGEDVTFPFTITGPEGFSEAPSLQGGGFASYPDITPGDYTITENVPDGWLLTGLLCNTVAIEPITNPITVTVEAGQEVFCTFTNSIKVVEPTTGKLTIQKNAEGGEDVTFPFTITGPEGFSEAPSLQGGGFASYPDITPGDYTITENVPDGWLLTGLLCNTVAIEPITNPITVTVEAGQEVFCTFTNSIKVVEPTTGKLTIQKNAEGGEDVTFPFTITGPEGFSEAPSLQGGGFASYPDITPGDYTITENVPDGWLLTGLLCNTVAIEPITNPITVTVEAGQEVFCTFTNSIKVVEPTTGKLTIQKNAEGGEDVTFPFTITGPEGFSEAPSLQGGGFASYPDITPGDYTITENVPDGWLLTGLLCNTVAIEPITNPITVTVEAGQEVFCTFTNSIKVVEPTRVPDLTVSKTDGQTSVLGGTQLTYTITITNNGDATAQNVSLSDTFSQTVRFISGSTSQGVCEFPAANALITGFACANLGNIAPTASVTVTVTVEAPAVASQTTLRNTACAATTGELNTSNNCGVDRTTLTPPANICPVVPSETAWRQDLKNHGQSKLLPAGSVTPHGTVEAPGYYIGVIVNTNASRRNCTYLVGLASYHKFDEVIDNQVLQAYDWERYVGPGETIYLKVPKPECAAQIDLFYGDLLLDLNGKRYGVRLIEARHVLGKRYCAEITIKKQSDPANGTSFNFAISQLGENFSLANGGQFGPKVILPNTLSVTETLPAGWEQTDFSCVSQSGADVSYVRTSNDEDPFVNWDVTVEAGKRVVCTVTNTYNEPQTGTLIVRKDVQPDGVATEFPFEVKLNGEDDPIPGGAFNLGDNGSKTLDNLGTGTYSVREKFEDGFGSGFIFGGIVCDNGVTLAGEEGAANNYGVNVTLAAGQTITCTFTNYLNSDITIRKQTIPAESDQLFQFTSPNDKLNGKIGDGGFIQFTEFTPGTYDVTEVAVDGWTLRDIVCVDRDNNPYANAVRDGNTIKITVGYGDSVTCTFINEQDEDPVDDPWDKSSIRVTVQSVDCETSTVVFSITNAGSGDMASQQQWRLYEGTPPQNYTQIDSGSFQLTSGASVNIVYTGSGPKVKLEADQHPLHPGGSQPQADIEFDDECQPAQSVNQPPTAVISGELTQTLTCEQSEVMFSLSGVQSSDSDGSIVSYLWSTGQTDPVISLSRGVGSHPVSLTVTDNESATGSTEVVLSVNEAQNCASPEEPEETEEPGDIEDTEETEETEDTEGSEETEETEGSEETKESDENGNTE